MKVIAMHPNFVPVSGLHFIVIRTASSRLLPNRDLLQVDDKRRGPSAVRVSVVVKGYPAPELYKCRRRVVIMQPREVPNLTSIV